jgi:integrase
MASKNRNNVRKRGNSWTYYLYVVEGDGTRRQTSKGGFATRREAEDARVAALGTVRDGSFVRPKRITVREFLVDEWLPSQRPPTLEESTHHSYTRYINLHVLPHIGGIPLQQLTATDVNRLYRHLLDHGRLVPGSPRKRHEPAVVELVDRLKNEGRTWQQVADAVAAEIPSQAGITRHAVAALHRRAKTPTPTTEKNPGLKPRTVRYVHTILHAALRDAVRWNLVARSVAHDANPPSIGSTKSGRPNVWTVGQLSAFLDHVADNRYLPAWIFLATTGCRRGEALGIHWTDLDFERTTAVISRQVTAVNHQIRIKPLTKTKHGHVVDLDPDTLDMLRRWKARQNEEKLLAGPGYRDDGFVFTHPDGSVYHPDRFSREFLRNQESYNRLHPDEQLPRLVLHGLRHTWATLALEDGIDIHIVSAQLDHSSTHLTSEIYTHVTRPMRTDATRRVAARIFGRG